MTLIEAKVVDQTLTVTKKPLVASGGINETSILFSFCPNWSDFIKTAVFTDAKKTEWFDAVIDDEGKAVVPAQVTAEKGRFWFGVVGFKDQTRYTTQVIQYDVAEGAALSGEETEIPQSIINQIMADIDTINTTLETLTNEVDDLKNNGGQKAETPVFDLVALGLPNVPYGDTIPTFLETDTTEIMAALEKGEVTFKVNVVIDEEVTPLTATLNQLGVEGMNAYNCCACIPLMSELDTILIQVAEEGIVAFCTPIQLGATETPVFDLVALGLPAVVYGGTEAVSVETNTTEIMAALAKGVVIFKLNISLMGNILPVTIAANPMYLNGGYSWMLPQPQENGFITFALNVVEGAVLAQISFTPFDKVATDINMSSFDTNGQIVETYADGSTKTSTIEFDSDGNPIKITDSDGNVTTLTW